MHLKNSDIFAALGIVLLNVVELLVPYTILWVSILLTLPMVFFVPGYMLTAVLTHTRRLNVFHRLTFSLGLSLTIDILAGFLLNVLPIGLRTQSWVVLLSCLTLLFALVVLYLRRGMVYIEEDRQRTAPMVGQLSTVDFSGTHEAPVGTDLSRPCSGVERPTGRDKSVPTGASSYPSLSLLKNLLLKVMGQGDRKGLPYMPRPVIWPRVRDGFVFALAITLVILSLMYATRGVTEGAHSGFTQLWMLPPSHTAQNCAVNVGIRSFENDTVTYHAVMTMNGTRTLSWPTLTLTPNQLWERSIAVTPTTLKDMFVELKLYRNDKPTVVYREVHTTLTVLIRGQKIVSCG